MQRPRQICPRGAGERPPPRPPPTAQGSGRHTLVAAGPLRQPFLADSSLLCGLLAGEPNRRGIVFDLPAVAEGASQALESAGLSDRVEVLGGSFFDRVPAADVYLMSLVLHDWDDQAATRILRNVAGFAKPGARLDR
jgi:hypothetical protein